MASSKCIPSNTIMNYAPYSSSCIDTKVKLMKKNSVPVPYSRVRFQVKASINHGDFPLSKRDDFHRSRLSRAIEPPSLIEKAKCDIMEYCSEAEGDVAYDSWQAFFHFIKLQEECEKLPLDSPERDRLENLIRRTGNVKDLIQILSMLSITSKPTEEKSETEVILKPFPVPDELPKRIEELEYGENDALQSPYTSMLRKLGRNCTPAWYSQRPDHETD